MTVKFIICTNKTERNVTSFMRNENHKPKSRLLFVNELRFSRSSNLPC